VEYWVREFTPQGTDLLSAARPGRPFTDVSTQIAWLLNDESFSSTRYLVSQLTTSKIVVKMNIQEIMGFHKFNLKWVPNVLSDDQKAARVAVSHELENNLLSERRNNFFTIIRGAREGSSPPG
jgi:hypothetical protein